jgi:oxygen-independent coproporphyrinogen-3 oxidase
VEQPDLQAPFGIYLSFPFCPVKCHYCAFGTRLYSPNGVSRYGEGIRAELNMARRRPELGGRTVGSIYIGGGSPTLLPDELSNDLKQIKEHFDVRPDAEISLEAYPSGIHAENLAPLVKEGFNRISFGVQSFFDEDLVRMNRSHTAREVHDAIRESRDAGFWNLNLDLIYGLPGQTLRQWEENLRIALQISPEHLSVYGLTIEENTHLSFLEKRGRFRETDDELTAEMFETAISILRGAGYHHYEISNFARPGRESRHNLLYWTQGDFLGIGPGAASYLSGRHTLNEATLDGYLRKIHDGESPVAESETLTIESRLQDAIVFGLRKLSGVHLESMQEAYRSLMPGWIPRLDKLVDQGYLRKTGKSRFSLTEKGILFSDHVSMMLSGSA